MNRKSWWLSTLVVNALAVLTGILVFHSMGKHLQGIPITLRTSANETFDWYFPIRLGERFLPAVIENHDWHIQAVLEDGQTLPIIQPSGIFPDRTAVLTVPFSLPRFTEMHLMLRWNRVADTATVRDLPEPSWIDQSGGDGWGITSWTLKTVESHAGNVAFEGRSMLELTLSLDAAAADHYTNDLIHLDPCESTLIHDDSYLCYALLYPVKSDLRLSLQPLVDNEPVLLDGIADQNGIDAGWTTPLDAIAIGRWYYRVIPLASFAGATLTGISLFANDSPTLSSEDCSRPVTVLFDGIHVSRGGIPDCAISNPLREFARAAVNSQGFLLLVLSILIWLGAASFLKNP